MCVCVEGGGGRKATGATSPINLQDVLNIARNHAQSSITGTYLHTGSCQNETENVPMEKKTSEKVGEGSKYKVIVVSTVFTIDYLAARSKPR